MPIDIIEMLWGCVSCNAENKGRHKTCTACGSPRTEASPEWMPDDISPMAAVKDSALLHRFKAGRDWKCPYCGTSQFRADGTCVQCGSTQGDTSTPNPEWLAGRTKELEWDKKVEDPVIARPKPIETKVNPLEPYLEKVSLPWRGLLLALLVTAGVATLLYFVFRTRIVEAKVSEVYWQRTVKVERYQLNADEGWSVPGGALEVKDLGSRIHHYDKVQVGSHKEPYQETYTCGQTCRTVPGSCSTTPRSCVSNRNGSATCSGGDQVCSPSTQSCTPQYCSRTLYRTVPDYQDQPRYQDWYSWKLWSWTFNRNVSVSGTTTPQWPSGEQVALGDKERESDRSETFKVKLLSDTPITYSPKSEAEFSRFHVGATHKLKVGVAHGVEVLP